MMWGGRLSAVRYVGNILVTIHSIFQLLDVPRFEPGLLGEKLVRYL